MVKILYGVCGEGFGHSSRAETVSSLLTDHEILFAGSQKSYSYLKERGKDILRVPGMGFALKNHRIDAVQTIVKNIENLRELSSFGKLLDTVKKFGPDIIISDFEPYTSLLAKILQKPLISIDHQHVIDRTKIVFPKRFNTDFFAAKLVTSNIVTFAAEYIVTSFFFPEISAKNTVLVPPLIRKEIVEVVPTIKDYTLVYHSYSENETLTEMLKGIPNQKFVVYGAKKRKSKNITIKPISKQGFIQDLASAKAVITNGGYTLISEALFLGKPVLSMPVAGQFEQVMNALYLDTLGLGKYYDELDDVKIIGFLHNLQKYQKKLKSYKGNGNRQLQRELARLIRQSI